MVVRRAAPVVILLALAASAVVMMLGQPRAALVLTVSAAVGILSTICLEAALTRILQPGKPRFSRTAAALTIGHFAVWAVFLAGLYRWRSVVDLWAVAAGIGCFLLGLSMGGMNTRGGSPREE